MQRELRPHCRFLLPVTHALRDEIAEIFGRRTERNTRKKESISIKLSLLILNLEEGDITLVGPRSLKTKVLPVAVDK